jgi:hypothetical protein
MNLRTLFKSLDLTDRLLFGFIPKNIPRNFDKQDRSFQIRNEQSFAAPRGTHTIKATGRKDIASWAFRDEHIE